MPVFNRPKSFGFFAVSALALTLLAPLPAPASPDLRPQDPLKAQLDAAKITRDTKVTARDAEGHLETITLKRKAIRDMPGSVTLRGLLNAMTDGETLAGFAEVGGCTQLMIAIDGTAWMRAMLDNRSKLICK